MRKKTMLMGLPNRKRALERIREELKSLKDQEEYLHNLVEKELNKIEAEEIMNAPIKLIGGK
jgi:hypothetical protein